MNNKRSKTALISTFGLLIVSGLATVYAYANVDVYRMPVSSMKPTIEPGDKVQVDCQAYQSSEPKRWDVIAFKSPKDENRIWLFRIVGMPGEAISLGAAGVTIDGKLIVVPTSLDGIKYAESETGNDTVSYPFNIPEYEYFVLGDNPDKANDSRFWGTVSRDTIIGLVNP
ncbi:signal peptidase I [Rhodopirellula bahusiensis]|nr:signal peptidase I [Rhodopirellula bahusiensis]